MSIGRNDPCPCGSGKKYKKCCMRKDLEERHRRLLADAQDRLQDAAAAEDDSLASQAEGGPSGTGPDRLDRSGGPQGQIVREEPVAPRDLLVEAQNDLWEEVEAADTDERVAIFLRALDSPEVLGEGFAFELLSSLRRAMIARGEWQRFEMLVGALRERAPDAYEADRAYFLSQLIEDMLVTGRFERAAELGREFGARSNIDAFILVLGQVAYYGQTGILLEMRRLAWPWVRDDDNIFPHAIDEFAAQSAWLELLDYWQRSTSPRADDSELLSRLAIFVDDLRPEWPPKMLGLLDQGAALAVRPADELDPAADKDIGRSSEAKAGCLDYAIEFAGYLIAGQHVPAARALLAREVYGDFLQWHLTALRKAASRPRRTGKKRRRAVRVRDVLCPRRKSAERFLSSLCGFLVENYPPAIFLEFLPAWLRFLAGRRIIGPEEHGAAYREAASLCDAILAAGEKHPGEPALSENVRRAWAAPPESAVGAAPRP